jgi:hypothetical protein
VINLYIESLILVKQYDKMGQKDDSSIDPMLRMLASGGGGYIKSTMFKLTENVPSKDVSTKADFNFITSEFHVYVNN